MALEMEFNLCLQNLMFESVTRDGVIILICQ